MRLRPRAGAHRRRHRSRRLALPRPSLGRLSASPRPPARRPLPDPLCTYRRGPDRRSPGRRSPDRRRAGGRRRPPPVERRRARALLVGAAIFAAVVLLSALPWSTLLNQHAQLASDTAEVSALQAQNRALAGQARQLSDSSTQSALARQDYGLVRPGQKAYALLPPAGQASTGATDAGHVPLDEPPVVPGSRRSEELLGAGVASTAPSGGSAATTVGPSDARGTRSPAGRRGARRFLDAAWPTPWSSGADRSGAGPGQHVGPGGGHPPAGPGTLRRLLGGASNRRRRPRW